MVREQFTFEGLDSICSRLKRRAHDVAYVALWDRTDRNQEESLGRFELNANDAWTYLQEGEAPEPEGEGWEEPERPSPDEPLAIPHLSAADLAEAACRWLRDSATRNTVGENYRRFRVRAYGPKGIRVVDTGSFVCKNEDVDLDLPMSNGPDLQIPSPTFEDAANAGAAKGVRALGDYYAQWGQIVLGSVGQLQGVNNAMLARLHRQLQESRDQVDQLVAAILESRVAESRRADDQKFEEKAVDARTELARDALKQIGQAATAMLTSKGVTPEMGELLGVIGQSPELVATLADPDVRALMQDPENLKLVSGMLKQVAGQARTVREAAPAEV